MKVHLLVVSIVLGCTFVACQADQGESCSDDGMCTDGLVCHRQRCETLEVVAAEQERREQTENAVDGYHELVAGCAAAFRIQEVLAKDDEHLAELMQRQGTAGVAADEWVDVEIDEETYLGMMDHLAMYLEAHVEACRIGIPLYDENPVFQEAVRRALRTTLPDDEPGPSMPSEIAFCSPEIQGPLEWYLEEAAVESGIASLFRQTRVRLETP